MILSNTLGVAAIVFFALNLSSTGLFAQDRSLTQSGTGAIIRSLDRTTGKVQEHNIPIGAEITRAKLTLSLLECRYPIDNIDADAFAHMEIIDNTKGHPLFVGWMIASSPALSALEHPRYDFWVIKCTTLLAE